MPTFAFLLTPTSLTARLRRQQNALLPISLWHSFGGEFDARLL